LNNKLFVIVKRLSGRACPAYAGWQSKYYQDHIPLANKKVMEEKYTAHVIDIMQPVRGALARGL
jgi:hypothetical protein